MQVGISGIRAVFKKIALADCGQSITEYALMCALVAFGATAGYQGLAEGIASAYNTVSMDFSGAFGSASGSSYGGGKGAGASNRGAGQDTHSSKPAVSGGGGKSPLPGKGH
jgi:Flp pilus assembly pilin Flp